MPLIRNLASYTLSVRVGTVIFVAWVAIIVSRSLYWSEREEVVLEMDTIAAIAKNTVKHAASGEVVDVESFWTKQACVITFFRRFGCAFCRLAAHQLNSIKPLLDKHDVRLIGIGVEKLGVEEFLEKKFFDGELYIDEEKKCYKDLKYKRFGVFSLLPALVVKTSRDAIYQAHADKLGGDMKGDYYQVGGTLVISAGGDKILFNHKQESLADHADLNDILKSLNISESLPGEDTTQKPGEDTAQKPGEDTAQKPGEDTAQKPGEDTAQKPGEDTTQKPGENITQNAE